MKSQIIAVALIIYLGVASVAQAEQKTIRIDVDGLVCAFCAQGIEKKMKAQAATDKVFVSLQKKIVAVALKEGQDISDEKIRSEITDAGYVVRGITRTDESFDAVKAKIKAAKS